MRKFLEREFIMKKNEHITKLKEENHKLHTRYIITISIIICIGSIIMAIYNNEAFVSQVSFAGTISSIILSVLAIWMSISGERTTNDIRIKIAESTERLSGTTKEVKSLNKKYENTMNEQLTELKNVQEQLTKIIHSVDNVGEQVSIITQQKVYNTSNISTDINIMNTEQRTTLFYNIYRWTSNGNYYQDFLFCKMVYFVISGLRNSKIYTLNEVINYLIQSNININFYMRDIEINWGVINTLSAASVFNDETAVNTILETINTKISSY